MELAFFIIFSTVAVGSALSVIFQKNPIYSALSLIVVIASIGGLFLLLKAPFLAVLQIIIYAGAVMVLFLFVIMMVDVGHEPPAIRHIKTGLAFSALVLIAGLVIWAIVGIVPNFQPLTADFSVTALSRQLFTSYVFPFEAISLLIVSAVIGALYIARKENA
jgi:NADH-quinone oxidoreductase subunit J